ncbi:MAG: hypothetical protein H6779_05370 [Candidatus Nomurabacteria bacterium]|nr:MAG: hypothetical protein H6779_05370 [Candidatus Nomurabacteria bacterium]
MKKIITSLGMIVFVGAVVVGGTGAFFSDTETSTGNVFTAGAIDLKVDSVGHINGLVCHDDTDDETDNSRWIPEDQVVWNPDTEQNELAGDANVPAAIDEYNEANPANVPQAGEPCGSTWALTDLLDGVHTFFNFDDIKPGDEGENTISLHIDNNDAWMCVDIDITKNDDVSSTEPELEDGDVEEEGTDDFDGELAQHMNFFAWLDDGDNIWQTDELPLFTNTSGPASDVLGGRTYALADSTTGNGPIAGGETHYIGLAWCAGEIDALTPGVILCDGSTMGNEAQTDMMEADIAFRVEQARNNGDFTCVGRDVQLPAPALTIDKEVTFSSSTIVGVEVSDFQLVITGPDAATTTTILSDEVKAEGLAAGVYTISEVYSGDPSGVVWDAQFSGACSEIGDSDDGTITLANGDDLLCNITNVISPIQ